MKAMKDGRLHALHVLHGSTVKGARTYAWVMHTIG
jgi:hypothetical protein